MEKEIYIKENLHPLLIYSLKCHLAFDLAPDYEELRKLLDEDFNNEKNFKANLADVILNHKISNEIFEHLTDLDEYTNEEVSQFLIEELWKPLYGNEPIKHN